MNAPSSPSTQARMHVDHWMSKTVHTAAPASCLMYAFEIMRDFRIRHVPILDGEKLVGIVSDRDIRSALPSLAELRQGSSLCRNLLMRPIEEVMTSMPITIGPRESIRTAAEIMCREKISALPVTEDGKLVGILSAEDILGAMIELL